MSFSVPKDTQTNLPSQRILKKHYLLQKIRLYRNIYPDIRH